MSPHKHTTYPTKRLQRKRNNIDTIYILLYDYIILVCVCVLAWRTEVWPSRTKHLLVVVVVVVVSSCHTLPSSLYSSNHCTRVQKGKKQITKEGFFTPDTDDTHTQRQNIRRCLFFLFSVWRSCVFVLLLPVGVAVWHCYSVLLSSSLFKIVFCRPGRDCVAVAFVVARFICLFMIKLPLQEQIFFFHFFSHL